MSAPFIDTGLKAIDLFAPIPLGGDVLITGEPKSGARVLGTELVHRFSRRPGNAPGTTVFLDPSLPDVDACEAELKETVAGSAEVVRIASVTADVLSARLPHRPFTLGNAVFAISLQPSYINGFLRAVKTGREANLYTKLTSFVVTEGMERNNFDARLNTIRKLAAEAIFPAIDVRDSRSNASGLDRLAPDRGRISTMAREAISRIMSALSPGSIKDESWIYHTDQTKRPALQALLFLSQPFFCAEPYTGMASSIVPVATTVDNFRSILNGSLSSESALRFRFLNSLDGIR